MSILDMGGSSGNSAILRPSLVSRPSSSSAPRLNSISSADTWRRQAPVRSVFVFLGFLLQVTPSYSKLLQVTPSYSKYSVGVGRTKEALVSHAKRLALSSSITCCSASGTKSDVGTLLVKAPHFYVGYLRALLGRGRAHNPKGVGLGSRDFGVRVQGPGSRGLGGPAVLGFAHQGLGGPA
eukprot:554971-Prorocentrum_minimum.AAC.1